MAVAIRKTKDIVKAIREIFQELDFIPKKRVFIKPNLCGREPIRPGENTSIAVMDALVEILLKQNCQVIIGHDELLSAEENFVPFDQLMQMSGFDKYKNIPGVKIINLDELARAKVALSGLVVSLPLEFIKNEVDTYINLAKVKTHMETTVSLSLKNQMGLPLKDDRKEMHKGDLERLFAEMALHIKPHINISEAYPAMDKNGPHHGRPKELDFIAAGRDMVELDSFVCRLLGYNPEKIPHLRYARDFKVGNFFNETGIAEYADFMVDDFEPAKKIYSFGTRICAYPTYSCSQCILAVDASGRAFKKHPFKYLGVIFKAFFSRQRINIVFGYADDLELPAEDRYICIGDCAKEFARSHNAEFLPGCPPNTEETKRYIVNKIKG